MLSTSLLALSPLDGRYATHTKPLTPFFSEYALIRYRIKVEVEYLISLSELNLKNCPPLSKESQTWLRDWSENFSMDQASEVKEIEKGINHDVKAVEYAIKQFLENHGLQPWVEFVHFGLTSQDINNTAIPLSLKECYNQVVKPAVLQVIAAIDLKGREWLEVPMLARTHGQPATPTRFGKELLVFSERLQKQLHMLDQVPFMAKFGGATGGFNAHHVAYPKVNWIGFADQFVASLGLERSQFTTQIEHYDSLAAFFDGLARINTILIDFSRDVWQYISMDYLTQKIVDGEVGSSAMPHKVNPIDFENAEGNLGIANAVLHHFSQKLPVSRLQRDLSDSTVLRNLGVPIGHCMVAYLSLMKGFQKLDINIRSIEADLKLHPEVVSEAIQTILRREGYPRPYEIIKGISRTNSTLSLADIHAFIATLDLEPEVRNELFRITPMNYLGVIPPNLE